PRPKRDVRERPLIRRLVWPPSVAAMVAAAPLRSADVSIRLQGLASHVILLSMVDGGQATATRAPWWLLPNAAVFWANTRRGVPVARMMLAHCVRIRFDNSSGTWHHTQPTGTQCASHFSGFYEELP
ncbi:MAG: hypothetical protein ACREBW_01190, partial [Candidatus Micrarchaeaceae archaeon]